MLKQERKRKRPKKEIKKVVAVKKDADGEIIKTSRIEAVKPPIILNDGIAETKTEQQKMQTIFNELGGEDLTAEALVRIRHAAQHDLPMVAIAARAGVSKTTLYKWMAKYPELSELIEMWKAQCLGDATETFTVLAKRDPQAAFMFLKHRSRDYNPDMPPENTKGNLVDDKTTETVNNVLNQLQRFNAKRSTEAPTKTGKRDVPSQDQGDVPTLKVY